MYNYSSLPARHSVFPSPEVVSPSGQEEVQEVAPTSFLKVPLGQALHSSVLESLK